MLTHSTIQGYEECSFNAWPALQSVIAGGWLLRFAEGHTRRTNSVNALSASVELDEIIDFAGPLYRQQDLPLIFRVTPLVPEAFDRQLEQQGFHLDDSVLVMARDLNLVLEHDAAVNVSHRPSLDWLRGVDDAAQLSDRARATQAAMLAAQRVPTAFATLFEDGIPLAYGMAAYERGAVGLFKIVTLPHARRRGAAIRLCRSLLAWGQQHGARSTYLQVEADNPAALALYEKMGFSMAYEYHYRVRV